MPSKIVIATDGSAGGERAAAVGIELARLSRAGVVAVYVADTKLLERLGGILPYPGAKESMKEAMIDYGRKATERVAEMASQAGLCCEKTVLEGDPAGEVMRLSEEMGAKMIVIGSLGKSGIQKALMGSVAERLVRESRVPVMVVPIGSEIGSEIESEVRPE